MSLDLQRWLSAFFFVTPFYGNSSLVVTSPVIAFYCIGLSDCYTSHGRGLRGGWL